jgi:hypothetical protein
MKECDWVRLIAEKEKYAKEGIRKGMIGMILLPECVNGEWDVGFNRDDLSTTEISIEEIDLELVEE